MKDKKIVLVDDSPTMRRIIYNCLLKIGFKQIVHAENGLDAITKIKSDNFDLIITDWNMPGMDGIELVKKLRDMKKYKLIPILMASTKTGKQDIKTAFESGVNDYLIKPFSGKNLKEKITELLRGHE
jgi:two-component system, chemotaxis family, chemotaxis protein CheY